MAWDRPTLPTLIQRVASDIESRLLKAKAHLPRTTEGVLARVVAGGINGVYGAVAAMSRKMFVTTCRPEDVPLHGEIWKVPRVPGARATGVVTGTGTSGAVLERFSEFVGPGGVLYRTTEEETVISGGITVEIEAVEVGTAGNMAGGNVRLVNPIPGIDSTFINFGLSGGVDIEDVESWRRRIHDRIADPPRGGALGDYVAWSLEVPGVTRVWEQPNALGPGTIRVVFVRDNDGGSIVPSSSEINAVQVHLQEWMGGTIIGGVAPLDANVYVVAPTLASIDINVSISRAAGYSTAQVQASVEAALDAFFLTLGPGSTVRVSELRAAISSAEGEVYHNLTTPAADVTHTELQLPVRGTVTITWL